jgi:GDPmannose 4,6-dehydratase
MPQTSFRDLVSEMMRDDLKLAERDELVKRQGFRFFNHHE